MFGWISRMEEAQAEEEGATPSSVRLQTRTLVKDIESYTCRSRNLCWLGLSLCLSLSLLFITVFFSSCPCPSPNSYSSCLSLDTRGKIPLRLTDIVSKDQYKALSGWNRCVHNNGSSTTTDPCWWFPVVLCSQRRLVILYFRDHLQRKLGPNIWRLACQRSIILQNISIPCSPLEEISRLKQLELLDLDYNNISRPVPLKIRNGIRHRSSRYRRLLQQQVEAPTPSRSNESGYKKWNLELSTPSHAPSSPVASTFPSPVSPSPSQLTITPPISLPPESLVSPPPKMTPVIAPGPSSVNIYAKPPSPSSPRTQETVLVPSPNLASTPNKNHTTNGKQSNQVLIICAGVIGGSLIGLASAVGFAYLQVSKVIAVRPWATGLSGQLQKAFTTGVPKLNRTELQAACEDFSNIIGDLSNGTLYKGTLSSGVEIAVASTAVASTEDWSNKLEAQFRSKIDKLSKLNHKNFVNLIGFCEEEKPFTRMMVFEYAPNGTLFEHLHIKESEQLDWQMRLRIAMGTAYCLEYMHQSSPPIAHRNLNSHSIFLTEDYAAKVFDFSFWNDLISPKLGFESDTTELPKEAPSVDLGSNIYGFGLVLFEMITGRIPLSVNYEFIVRTTSSYLKGQLTSKEIMDPTLCSFQEDCLPKLFQVIEECINPEPKRRPKMREITERLKEITSMEPEGATPKLSPLWWAELEITSTV